MCLRTFTHLLTQSLAKERGQGEGEGLLLQAEGTARAKDKARQAQH